MKVMRLLSLVSRGSCAGLALMAIGLALAGCAAPPRERPPVEFAAAPGPDSPFAPIDARIGAGYGAESSGFLLLERSDEALLWRLALIDSARHSIDLQYYVWFGDAVGVLLMDRVIAAADRGVRVRLLFDDLNTLLHDMASIELRDEALSHIDAHPNIEIRLFNPWHERSLPGRAIEAIGDFKRLNRRMHNKQMVVDNRVAVIGGRNIGNEYFGAHPEFNFLDLDVLGAGQLARQASVMFDRYWNSAWVGRAPRAARPPQREAADLRQELAVAALANEPALRQMPLNSREWKELLDRLSVEASIGTSRVHTDSPSRAEGVVNHTPEAFRQLLRSARREVIITNAYIIPDASFIDDLRALAERGVRVRILTNSLASHDVPAVNSHYQRWRRPIIETGTELYELRPDAAMRVDIVDLPPSRAEFVGLHTKAMVIDEERAFVGSMNLDPRSEILNAEMGVVIDSPALASALARRLRANLAPANSWRVDVGPSGELRWRGSDGEQTVQPARSFWQRVENALFMLFPQDLY
jgi:putative cardiolipin synthase